ncbi:hypothetical protein ACIBO1_31545 [Micromonospora sp. NPDC049903]|uniref:hypothetical protein n=1 Tax=Micromonospora sp. NPDC049903 TaxID=3364276 RepID=UPI0037A6F013
MPQQDPDPHRATHPATTASNDHPAHTPPTRQTPPGHPLRHSPLHLPHDRLTVTSLDERDGDHYVAFTATLCLDGTPVGEIRNEGDGAATRLRCHDPTRFTERDMHEFVRDCRYRRQPTDEETVLDRLVAEYDLDTRIATLTPNSTMARTVDIDGDYCGDIVTVETDDLDRLDQPTGRAGLAIYLATATTSPCCSGWQIWRHDTWHRVAPLIR